MINMKSIKYFVGLSVAVVMAMASWTSAVNAKDFVVLSSNVKALTPGKTVSADKALKIPSRRRVVLVNASGRTVVLKGPYKGKPGAPAKGGSSKLVTALASLVRTTQKDLSSVGAIRAAGIKTFKEAMMVNISETGDYCSASKAAPELTRYRSETAKKVTMTSANDGKKVVLTWKKGTASMPWPNEIPYTPGATFLIQQEGKDSRTMLVARKISGNFSSKVHFIMAIAEKGCMEQAKMLLALLNKSAK